MTQFFRVLYLSLAACIHQTPGNLNFATQGIHLFTNHLLFFKGRITVQCELLQLGFKLRDSGDCLLVLLLHHIHINLATVFLLSTQLGKLFMCFLKLLLQCRHLFF